MTTQETITTQLAGDTSALSSSLTPVLRCSVTRVHNFDLPVEDTCTTLLRGPLGTSTVCGQWGARLTDAGLALPRVDALSSTDPEEYYVMRAWFQLMGAYARSAQQLNRYDREMVDRAASLMQTEVDYAEKRIDTLYADQRKEDALQAAVDCPESCADELRKQYAQQARERMREPRGQKPRERTRRRTQRLYVPIDRSPMDDFAHLLNDMRFESRARDVEERRDTTQLQQKGVLRAQLLGRAIHEVLVHAQRVCAQLVALVDRLLSDWDRLRCTHTDAPLPLMTKLAFQRQLKTVLLDFSGYMQRQHVVGTIAVAQRRSIVGGVYYPHFTYQVSDCVVRCSETSTANAVVFDHARLAL